MYLLLTHTLTELESAKKRGIISSIQLDMFADGGAKGKIKTKEKLFKYILWGP